MPDAINSAGRGSRLKVFLMPYQDPTNNRPDTPDSTVCPGLNDPIPSFTLNSPTRPKPNAAQNIDPSITA